LTQEVSEKVLRKWGKRWIFGPGGGAGGHARVVDRGTNAIKIASGGNWVYIVSGPESKMEIPV